MNLEDSITVCTVCDARTIDQFKQVWPTWEFFKPSLLKFPWLVVCDAHSGDANYWRHQLEFFTHSNYRIITWDWPNVDDTEYTDMSQRERMLTAWVKVPPACVETDYWCKIDTDSVALGQDNWIKREWFRRKPALVASPWGYTKPATAIHALEKWALTIPELALKPALDLPPPAPDDRKIRHPRIASWICFVDTLFSRLVCDYCPGRLPVPSQDTLHWYVAWRRGEVIVRDKMKKYGWTNCHTRRGRKETIKRAFREYEEKKL